jgi:hypothetical protein
MLRNANIRREKNQPKNPDSHECELDRGDNFLVEDISVNQHRHLLFATTKQLELLQNGKVWYIDGTFSVVKEPFVQLLSVHCFVKHDDNLKEVPLVYCIMSRRSKTDYIEVFKVQKTIIPEMRVQKIVINYQVCQYNDVPTTGHRQSTVIYSRLD